MIAYFKESDALLESESASLRPKCITDVIADNVFGRRWRVAEKEEAFVEALQGEKTALYVRLLSAAQRTNERQCTFSRGTLSKEVFNTLHNLIRAHDGDDKEAAEKARVTLHEFFHRHYFDGGRTDISDLISISVDCSACSFTVHW